MRWLILAAVAMLGCSPPLPEPESPGAQVLQQRCKGCHRLYAPGSMTMPMWDLQLEKMRGIYAQKGLPWLSRDEQATLRAYLERFAGQE